MCMNNNYKLNRPLILTRNVANPDGGVGLPPEGNLSTLRVKADPRALRGPGLQSSLTQIYRFMPV